MHGVMRTLTLHRNVKQYLEARQVDGLLLLRIDPPLFLQMKTCSRTRWPTFKDLLTRDSVEEVLYCSGM